MLWAIAPRSAREELDRPRLPLAPVHRRYGLHAGRPVDRFYIERFLARHASDVRGRTLELLDTTYTDRLAAPGAVSRADVLDLDAANERATIHADLQVGDGIPGGAFDCFICTQTLSACFDLRAAVATMHQLLAPGGVLLLTVPGIAQQADPAHERFPDQFHFTTSSVTRLLEEQFAAQDVAVGADGNVASVAAFLYGLPLEEVEAGSLDPHDPDYEMVVWARAVRR
jgi:SAM-dependent methyltransferase